MSSQVREKRTWARPEGIIRRIGQRDFVPSLGIALLLVLLAIGTSAAPRGLVHAQSSIRVVSDSVSTEFPKNMVFKLQAEAEREIKEISIHYRLLPRNITRYGYLEFTKGTAVDATFTFNTGGANYIPPGVDIEYYYRVTDVSGESFETPHKTTTYMDGRFTWQELRGDQVTVYYYRRGQSTADQAIAAADRALDRMGKVLGVALEQPAKAIVYNSVQDMLVALPPESARTRAELITEGQAYSPFNLVLVLGFEPDNVSHELTHLLVGLRGGNNVPAWLNEGTAVYGQTINPGSYNRYLEQGIARNTLLSLRALEGRPGTSEDILLLYAEGYSMVRFLVDSFGPASFSQFIGAYDKGLTTDEAMQQTYGMGQTEIEALWRASIGAKPAPTPAPGAARAATVPAIPTLVPMGAQSPGNQPVAPPVNQPAGSPSEPTPAPQRALLLASAAAVIVVGFMLLIVVGFMLLRGSRRSS